MILPKFKDNFYINLKISKRFSSSVPLDHFHVEIPLQKHNLRKNHCPMHKSLRSSEKSIKAKEKNIYKPKRREWRKRSEKRSESYDSLTNLRSPKLRRP